jgi:putative ABC transport system ATP-binding protein
MDLIAMDGICKDYSIKDGVTTRVLKSIELFIEPGEFVSIMGPSGSGKSTLVNLLGTLDRQTEGVYLLDDEDIRDYDDAALAHIRNRTIGFVFQGFNLLARRTVIDNIALPLLYGGEERKEQIRRAEYYLDQVGLSTHRNHFPSQLSGGQQQRVAIARALIGEPKIILADEPTGSLDSKTSKEIMGLLSTLNQEGITIIVITHDMDIANYGQRLVQLKDGEIIYDGPKY